MATVSATVVMLFFDFFFFFFQQSSHRPHTDNNLTTAFWVYCIYCTFSMCGNALGLKSKGLRNVSVATLWQVL